MRRNYLKFAAAGLAAFALAAAPMAAHAEPKKEFKVGWSIYVGWMPWGYASDSGIVKKWADKYGISIEVKQFNDYVESINQYTAGAFDAMTMTNMDALSIPAAGGVDSTALIVGDYSNGNDVIIMKDKAALADIKGQNVNLVEFSVSHYMLARALETVGLAEKDLKVVNTSDADIVAAYKTPDVTSVVTWKPMASEILADASAKKVFDSSQIPGEIVDMMVANTQVLKDNPDFGKALVGIWYDVLKALAEDPAAKEAMANASGTDVPGFDEQLATTKLYSTPAEAVAFTSAPEFKKSTELVSKFLFDKALLGKDAKSPGAIGIEFPDKSVFGETGNVKLRYDTTWMQAAADGKL